MNIIHDNLKDRVLSETFVPSAEICMVSTGSEIKSLVARWSEHKVDWLGCDTETIGLNPHAKYVTEYNGVKKEINHPITVLQLFDGHKNYIFNIPKIWQNGAENVLLEELGPIFNTEDIVKVFFNARFDIAMLMSMGLYTKGRSCLMLGSKLAEGVELLGNNFLSLQKIVEKRLGFSLDKGNQLAFQDTDAKNGIFSEDELQYAAYDVEVLAPLYGYVHQKLSETDQLDAWEVDNYATAGVAFLERGGVPVNTDILKAIIEKEEDNLRQLHIKKELSLLGNVINLNSVKQLKEFYIENFGIELAKTDKQTLESLLSESRGHLSSSMDAGDEKAVRYWSNVVEVTDLAYQIRTYSSKARKMLESARFADKLNEGKSLDGYSSFIPEPKLTKTDAKKLKKMFEFINDKRYNMDIVLDIKRDPTVVTWVQTNLNQNGAVTSRFSSTGSKSGGKTNLQNIKSELRVATRVPEGFATICADYTAIELWELMQFTGHSEMIEALNSGLDAHKSTAALMNNVDYDQITKDMRSKAKAVNFGLIYGQGVKATAQKLGVSEEEAKAVIDLYFEKSPQIEAFLSFCKRKCLQEGYIVLPTGKRRYVNIKPDTPRYKLSGFARQATNAPMQGACAEIMKMALGLLADTIYDRGLENHIFGGITVHDEILLIAKSGKENEAAEILQYAMSDAANRMLPDMDMKIDVDVSRHWTKEDYLKTIEAYVEGKLSRDEFEWVIENYHNYGYEYKLAKSSTLEELSTFLDHVRNGTVPKTDLEINVMKLSKI